MTKTIVVKKDDGEEISLVLSNKISWLLDYRDQFNIDIVPTLMPLLLSISNMLTGLAEAGVDFNKVSINDISKLTDSDSFTEAAVKLSAFESTDILNIVWALNKAGDESISDPRTWIRQFDTFPFDEIIPVVFELVASGVMSSKNWERLQAAKEQLQPKPKKKSKNK